MNSKQRIKAYLKIEKRSIFLGTLLCFLYVACQIAQPFLLGRALDYSKLDNQQAFIIVLIVCLILTLLGGVFYYIFEVVMGTISQKIIKKMREDIYLKLNRIPIKEFDNRKQGDMLQLEIRDIENVSQGIFSIFKTLFQGVLTIVLTIIMMVVANWILAVGVVLLSPISVVVSSFVSSFNHKHFKKQANLQADVSALSSEAIGNLDIIQSLNYENQSIDKLESINKKLIKEGKTALFSASWVNPSTRLVNNIIYSIIGVAGIIMMAYDIELGVVFAVMTLGRVSSFLSYTNQYTRPFNDVSNVFSEYEIAKSSFNRINDFLSLDDDVDNGKTILKKIDSIEIKDLSFSYNKDRPLIENFSLKINKGNKIAIVGPTGAGKTTIINLIMRFYEPNSGQILINGIDYKEINKSTLREQMGMVLQDTWVFHGSVLDNIKYTKTDATIEEVNDACKRAHVDSFIDALEKGYDTIINGKEGLSEGQKQMISIARVMLKNPDLVILDEATSNIDTRSELLISKAFDEMMKDKTSIVIAHRLSTIKSADIIIVMKDGSIIEIGNHKDLMNKQGFYYDLYMSQYKN